MGGGRDCYDDGEKARSISVLDAFVDDVKMEYNKKFAEMLLLIAMSQDGEVFAQKFCGS